MNVKTVDKIFKNVLIYIFIILLLSSCIPAKKKEVTNINPHPECEGISVYGRLTDSKNGYFFDKFSTVVKYGEPWVKLNNGYPTWNVSTEYKCYMEGGGFIDICRTEDKTLFRSFVDVKIINLWEFASISLYGNIEFDWNKYTNAYNEAYSKLPDFFCSRIKSTHERLALLKEKYDEAVRIYDALYKKSQDSVEFAIVDRSSLFLDQCDFKDNIVVNITQNTLPFKHPKIPNLSTKNIDALFKDIDIFFHKNYDNNYFYEIKKATSYLNVEASCDKCKTIDYKLEYKKKATINKKNYIIPINVIIKSIYFSNIMPAKIIIKNKDLSLELSNNILYFSNLTNTYLTIDNTAFYYNNNISLVNDIINLPPHSSRIEFLLLNFFNGSMPPFFNDKLKLTKKKAQKLDVKVGFAIKYKIIDANKEITLFKTKKYNVFDIISSDTYINISINNLKTQ